MAAVLESLRAEHAKFGRFLDLFEAEVAKFEAGESPDYDLVDLLLDYFTSFPDEWHHKKEDHVYDALAAQPAAGSAEALYDLRAEHAHLEAGVRSFAQRIEHLRIGGDLPADVLINEGRRYAAQLRHHMAREDEDFIPAAERRLDEAAWNAISRAIDAELEQSGGAKLLEKLEALERRIEDAAGADG